VTSPHEVCVIDCQVAPQQISICGMWRHIIV